MTENTIPPQATTTAALESTPPSIPSPIPTMASAGDHHMTCTVIKPLLMGHQHCQVGDTLTLTSAQARPLQHAGFVTLDQAAAACIQDILAREQATLAAAPLLTDVIIEEAIMGASDAVSDEHVSDENITDQNKTDSGSLDEMTGESAGAVEPKVPETSSVDDAYTNTVSEGVDTVANQRRQDAHTTYEKGD